MHRKIKWMRGRCKGDSTDSVIITKPSGHQKLITDRETLETLILQENERKYHQTEGQCPLMENIMLRHLGTMATTPTASEIIQGSYKIPSTVGKATRNFLQACQRPKNFKLPSFDHSSKDQYIRSWRKARESTGSGKLHFGHWKSGIKDELIAHTQWLITFLPGKHGFSLISWRQATDVMILKKSGVLNIERLRTIVLYEADYNFFNKCVGRQAMDNGIYNNLVAEEQYSKPNSSAQDQCINRRLIFDLVRHTKQAMALASSDLKSCYDRIVHSAASLAMQRVGISQQVIQTMFDTVQKCEHKVCTAYGDSKNMYGPNTGQYKQPVMGVGQGNGAGPQIWSLISSVLFLAMHLEGFSTKFVSKLTSEFIEIIGYMYVDDMDLIQIKPYHQWHNLTETLQITLAYWNKLVKVTGGALEPSKSGWFAFRQFWDPLKGEYCYEDIGNFGEISTKDKDNQTVPLQYISCHDTQEMVGVLMGPTGNQQPQTDKLILKSKIEASLISRSKLDHAHAYTAVMHSIIPSLSYPLPCMTITDKEGKQILRPLLSASLPRMGVIPTLGYDFVYGSSSLYGLGIPELFHVCYSRQLEMLIQHSWRKSQTGKLITILREELFVEAGTSRKLFEEPQGSRIEQWLLTKNIWLRGLRCYAIDHNINMDVRENTFHSHRDNDQFFMDAMDAEKSLTATELKAINICRIFKRVMFLSDIASGDGERIAAWAWNKTDHFNSSIFSYPIQEEPTDRQWKAWKKGLKKLLIPHSQRLRSTLGVWKLQDNEYHSDWSNFINPTTRHLLRYNYETNKWQLLASQCQINLDTKPFT